MADWSENGEAALGDPGADEDGGFPGAGVVEFGSERPLTVREKKSKKKSKSGGFETLGLSPEIFRGIKRKGYQVPTPIQRKTLPLILAGYDVVAMARTGSGKTAAFLIPMLEKLRSHAPNTGSRAVILSPTRELALQTFKFALELGKYTDLRACVLVGGDSMESQFEELAKNPDILIATPGRLMHHLAEVQGMNLRSVEYAVFDEADRLFEMGFAEQLRQIINQMSEIRQTLLFSATMPKLLAEFARAGLKDPQIVRLDSESTIHSDLKLAFYTVRHEEKVVALLYLLREIIAPTEQTIIFVSTKYHVDYLNEILLEEGFSASIVYGAMDQTARKIHVAKFRSRKTMILLVTDVAARGIDIPLLDNVINFDFPPKPKLFVHRTGRVARAGRKGFAYSFLSTDELPYLLDLHLFLSKPIKPAPTEDEIEKKGESFLDELNRFMSEEGTVYGRLPQWIIDLGMEKVREITHKNSAVQSLHSVCAKAFKRYIQSRPPPSSQSIFRAKNLPSEGLHLSLRKEQSRNDALASAFAEHLKSFRPKQTVLESEAEVQKKAKNSVKTVGLEAMQMKRKAHEILILNKKKTDETKERIREKSEKNTVEKTEMKEENASKKRSSESNEKSSSKRIKKDNFRDEENYINSFPLNRFAERSLRVKDLKDEKFDFGRIDSEILDLIPEDSEGIQKKKSMYKWDKKSKKYVKLHAGEKMLPSGKIVNESGNKTNKGNHGLYEKWKQKSHKTISTFNNEEEGNTNGNTTPSGKVKKFGGSKKRSIPNANAKNELKSLDEVRRIRQKTIAKGHKVHGKTSNLDSRHKHGKGRNKGKGKK